MGAGHVITAASCVVCAKSVSRAVKALSRCTVVLSRKILFGIFSYILLPLRLLQERQSTRTLSRVLVPPLLSGVM